jgi:hypothetical protein
MKLFPVHRGQHVLRLQHFAAGETSNYAREEDHQYYKDGTACVPPKPARQ